MIDEDTFGRLPNTSQEDPNETSGTKSNADQRGTAEDHETASLLSPADKPAADDTLDGTVAGTLDSRG